ncbi:uncharacterized protein LOC106163749 [Lingula anatina]|uniref:Uncharacterized protein LOC106163749 n=1 Tax=Lingula anatina TaxID=7574 RepID=A0A1S3IG89_LINAN|nr:uncharacterized protein LOC106163749 [Lingula anatina]|eukprot:XP_013396881.1 uncharacterized protein LOC106163749 [Lingula anatina]
MSDLPSNVEPDFVPVEDEDPTPVQCEVAERETQVKHVYGPVSDRSLQPSMHYQRVPDPGPDGKETCNVPSKGQQNCEEQSTINTMPVNISSEEDSLDSGLDSMAPDVATSQSITADLSAGMQKLTLRRELMKMGNIREDEGEEANLSIPLQESGIGEQEESREIKQQTQQQVRRQLLQQQQQQQQCYHPNLMNKNLYQQEDVRQQQQQQQQNQISGTHPYFFRESGGSPSTEKTTIQQIQIQGNPSIFYPRPPPDENYNPQTQPYRSIHLRMTNTHNANTRFSNLSYATPISNYPTSYRHTHPSPVIRADYCYRGASNCGREDCFREDCVGCYSLGSSRVETGCFSGFPARPTEEQVMVAFFQDEDGDTQLHIAIILCLEREASLFISWAPRYHYLNIANFLGQTPLHLAVLTQSPVIVRKLMTSGATIETYDHNGNTPLHLASRDGDTECIRMLTTPVTYREVCRSRYTIPYQKIPQDLDLLNYEGQSCLHLAASRKHIGAVDYLISLGADINVEDGKSGRTILHHAVETRDIELLYYLLSQPDINLDARTYDNCSPLSLAMGRRYQDIATLLINNGALFSQWQNANEDDEEDEESSSDEENLELDDIMINGQPLRMAGEDIPPSW